MRRRSLSKAPDTASRMPPSRLRRVDCCGVIYWFRDSNYHALRHFSRHAAPRPMDTQAAGFSGRSVSRYLRDEFCRYAFARGEITASPCWPLRADAPSPTSRPIPHDCRESISSAAGGATPPLLMMMKRCRGALTERQVSCSMATYF